MGVGAEGWIKGVSWGLRFDGVVTNHGYLYNSI